MRIDLWDKGYVELVDNSKVVSYTDTMKFITDTASTTRGKNSSNNTEPLYQKLLTESGNREAGRPFEYILLNEDININGIFPDEKLGIINSIKIFNIVKHKKTFTFRGLLIAMKELGYDVENNHKLYFKDTNFKQPDFYKIVRGYIPKFVYDHIRTHTQISWLLETVRVKTLPQIFFWGPKGNNELYDFLNNSALHNYNKAIEHGIPNELAARELPTRRYVKFISAGYTNIKYSWPHFLIERTKKATQEQTRETVTAIKQLFAL